MRLKNRWRRSHWRLRYHRMDGHLLFIDSGAKLFMMKLFENKRPAFLFATLLH